MRRRTVTGPSKCPPVQVRGGREWRVAMPSRGAASNEARSQTAQAAPKGAYEWRKVQARLREQGMSMPVRPCSASNDTQK